MTASAPQTAKSPSIKLEDGMFVLNGSPFFIYSGEVHYFRMPRNTWKDRLRRLKQAGFNTVSSYIPWVWHETEEGKFDFTGETLPERDVLGFIRMAQEEKLHFQVRVGPVANAELKGEGIPHWLLKRYPEVLVKEQRDKEVTPDAAVLSYLHPVFQGFVDKWYAKLLPLLKDRQITRGGNVISVQLCNEIAMIHWLRKSADFRPHVTGFYRAYLEKTYGSVAALNKVYGTTYGSFAEVEQPRSEDADPARWQVFFDWALFYRRYYASYYRSLSVRARRHGVEVPLFCNIPQFYDYDIRGRGIYAPMTTSMFRDFSLLTPDVVYGGAYQMRHLDFENFHDVALVTEVTRLLGTVSVPRPLPDGEAAPAARLPDAPEFRVHPTAVVPTVCAELQTGIMRDRPRLYPQQVLLNVKSSVGQGLGGINAYMFAGGINPKGYGYFGTYHDWQAPIGPDGREKPHMKPLKDFGRFLKWAGPLLAAAKKAPDTAFGFYLPYYATEYMRGRWAERVESFRTHLWYDGLARLVQLAGFNYNMADLQRTPAEVLQTFPSLWLYTLENMDRDTQAKLAAYVKNGGKLALYPRLPSRDLMDREETTLARELGVSLAGEVAGNMYSKNGDEYWVEGPIQAFQSANGHRPLMPLEGGAAVLQKPVGKGQLLLIGMGLPHQFDHYRHWVRSWADSLGLAPRVECDPWDVQAVLREGKDYGFLFVYNYHFIPKEASLETVMPGTGRKVKLPGKGRLTLAPLSAVILPLNVPVAPGKRVVSATAELSEVKAGAKLELAFDTVPGQVLEVSVSLPAKPRSVALNGRKVPSAWKAGVASVSVKAQEGPSVLTVQ